MNQHRGTILEALKFFQHAQSGERLRYKWQSEHRERVNAAIAAVESWQPQQLCQNCNGTGTRMEWTEGVTGGEYAPYPCECRAPQQPAMPQAIDDLCPCCGEKKASPYMHEFR